MSSFSVIECLRVHVVFYGHLSRALDGSMLTMVYMWVFVMDTYASKGYEHIWRGEWVFVKEVVPALLSVDPIIHIAVLTFAFQVTS